MHIIMASVSLSFVQFRKVSRRTSVQNRMARLNFQNHLAKRQKDPTIHKADNSVITKTHKRLEELR